jgi:hypothetical protein
MDQAFYKYQLIFLTVICIVLVAYERYLKSKKSPPDHFKDHKVEESMEDGHSVLQTNGAAVLTSNVARAGALQTLMRKYLLVYAIVMGQSACYNLFRVLIHHNRRRLATRPIRLFPLSRTI